MATAATAGTGGLVVELPPMTAADDGGGVVPAPPPPAALPTLLPLDYSHSSPIIEMIKKIK